MDVFVDVVLHGRQLGSPGSPIAFEIRFGWVMAESTAAYAPTQAHHITLLTEDDLLHQFWEIKENIEPQL